MAKEHSTDSELTVMAECHKKMKHLTDEEKARVLDWLAKKFDIASTTLFQKKTQSSNASGGGESGNSLVDFTSLPDVFAVANVKTDQEKVLLASSYLQLKNGGADLTGREINQALKPLGQGVSNITNTITALMARKPKLMIQTHKSGKSRQAQKKYKVTTEGLAAAKKFLSETPESDE